MNDNAKKLREVLSYNQETGIFTRKKKTAICNKPGDIAGSLDKTRGYIRIHFLGKKQFAHRLAWLYMTGEYPENEIDHINQIKHDNRWANLRQATRGQNCKNTPRRKNNKSGVVGVSWDKSKNKWVATITVDRMFKRIGVFDGFQEAVNARKELEVLHGFHKNHGDKTVSASKGIR